MEGDGEDGDEDDGEQWSVRETPEGYPGHGGVRNSKDVSAPFRFIRVLIDLRNQVRC